MDTIKITSLEQVPEGLNMLFKKIGQIEDIINSRSVQSPSSTKPIDQLHTREETAKLLRITLATLNEYTKTGKIVANRIGGRVLYKYSDIQKALNAVKTSNLPV